MSVLQLETILLTIVFCIQYVHIIAKPTDFINEYSNDINEIAFDDKENIIYNNRVTYANTMLKIMNQTINPCDDFYEYSCGNWKNVQKKSFTKQKRDYMLDISLHINELVTNILTSPIDDINERYGSQLKLVQQYYQSCLKADLYPQRKSQIYLDVLETIGGFPAIHKNWQSTNFSWLNMSAHLSNYGVPSLINEKIYHMHPFMPYFVFPNLGFEYLYVQSNIDKSNLSQAHAHNEETMRSLLKLYDVPDNESVQIIEKIFEFWNSILNITSQFEENEDKCNELSIEYDVEHLSNWSDYFSIAWNQKNFTKDFLPCKYFYAELDKICNEHKEVVANYLALKFLYSMQTDIRGKEFQSEYCVSYIRTMLPFLIDHFFMKNYFKADLLNKVTDIVNKIRLTLRETINSTDWLSEIMRTKTLLRESDLTIRIGKYNNENVTDHIIQEILKLAYFPDNFEQNNLNLRQFSMLTERYLGLHLDLIDEYTKPLELMTGAQVNAFYYIDNSINIMAGVLYPPVYHESWPNALKFGTLGYMVGHELSHLIESEFDMDFTLEDKPLSNLTEEVKPVNNCTNSYNERVNCFVQHYNKFYIPEINQYLNGNQTKWENTADAGGLNMALKAYRLEREQQNLIENVIPKAMRSEEIPGLNLSPEQLFFLGFAQLWCADYKEQFYLREITEVHTPDKYRVLGALQLNEEFAKAYNCPVGSKMNPDFTKCHLW